MTLADDLIRTWSTKIYRKRIDFNGWVPRTIASARKFVLDDAMSAFMADLAYASLPPPGNDKRMFAAIDSMRMMSRLPHAVTWIEFNMRARAERSRDAYNAQLADYQGPERCGWLIECINNDLFRCVPCASQSMSSTDLTNAKLIDVPNAGAIAYYWTTGGSELDDVMNDVAKRLDYIYSRALAGVDAYRSPHVTTAESPFVTNNKLLYKMISTREAKGTFLQEQAGDLRFLWALLATINDIPTTRAVVRPTKGHMVGRNYKRFSEHTVITLRIPGEAQYTAAARRALRASRRRAHQVRGHWRIDWRNAPAALCEHTWANTESDVRCTHCKGRKTWVHEHQRGDASLGFVLHDYAVTHPNGART